MSSSLFNSLLILVTSLASDLCDAVSLLHLTCMPGFDVRSLYLERCSLIGPSLTAAHDVNVVKCRIKSAQSNFAAVSSFGVILLNKDTEPNRRIELRCL